MNTRTWKIRAITAATLLTIAVLLVLASSVLAAPNAAAYDLTWNVAPGGGTTFSTGGSYSLGSSAGQPAVNTGMTANAYTLVGGFWSFTRSRTKIFLPLTVR
jgi:hypothetical protein